MPYAAASLVGQGEGHWFLTGLYHFRQTGLELIYGYLPDPEASLLAGIVLGYESGIPEEVDQAFKDTGATPIIAISGFNITIVSGLTAVLLPYGGEAGYMSADWLAVARSSMLIASVDSLNLRGLPDGETLDLLAGYLLYRTDLHGSIELVTDGQQLWIYTEEQ
jgi:hypothetical protein